MVARSVAVRLTAEVSGYIANMTRAGAATRRAMGTAEASVNRQNAAMARGERAHRVLAGAAKIGAVAVVGGFALAVKAAADFEEKMALVQTLSHANQREMVNLSHAAKTVGTSFGYTASEVSDGEAEMVKAGISLRDIMGGGLKGALALAAAGQTDVATATTIAGSAMTEFRLKGKDIPHVADLLAAGADKALGSVTDLGYGLTQSGTTAHQFGISIEQTVGTLTAFAQAGLIGERGGTTFKQMLLQLASPTDKAQKLMDKFHLSLYDASGQIKTMPQLADNLKRSFDGIDPAARNAALGVIFGTRAIQGANIMMAEGGKGISKWITKVNDQGFAAQQARGKLNSLNGDLKKLKAEGFNALIDLGSGSQSPLRHLVQDLTHGIHDLTVNGSLKRWGNETADAFSSVAQGAKPILEIAGQIVSTFNDLPTSIKTGLATAGLAALTLRKVPGLRSGPLGAAAGGLSRGGGVVPVFVTNAGFGGPGKGAPGGVLATGEKAGRFGRAGALASRVGGAINIPNIIAGTLAVQGIKSAKSGNAAIGAGAAGGAFLGARVGGPIGALAGAGIGAIAGAESYKDPAEKAYEKRNKTVKDLIKTYQLLKEKQKDLSSSDSTFISPAAQINADKMKNILTALGNVTGLTGKKLLTLAKGAGMPSQWTAVDQLHQLQFDAQKAGVGTQQLRAMLGSLPDAVITKLLTPGAVTSKKDVRELGRNFGLLPSQVKTLMTLLGFHDTEDKTNKTHKNLQKLDQFDAKPKISPNDQSPPVVDKVNKNLKHIDGTTAKPKISANDQASGVIGRVGGELSGLDGRSATVTITTRHVDYNLTVNSRINVGGGGGGGAGRVGRGTQGADGALYSGSTRQMAGGGFTEGGQYVPRIPQMRLGGGNILWSEPETGWEAYISGKPGMDERNRTILSMAASRLGMNVTARADGGIDDLHYRHNIRGVTRELRKLTAQLQKDAEDRKQYRASVRDAYKGDPFQGTLGGFDAQVAHERKNIIATKKNLSTLRSRGLSGGLYKDLAASGNVSLISQFAGLTRAQIAARERAFSARNRGALALGEQASGAVFGKEMRNLRGELRDLRHELHRLRTGHHIGNTNIRHAVIKDSEKKTRTKVAAKKARHGR